VSFTEHQLGQGRVRNFCLGDNGAGLGRRVRWRAKPTPTRLPLCALIFKSLARVDIVPLLDTSDRREIDLILFFVIHLSLSPIGCVEY